MAAHKAAILHLRVGFLPVSRRAIPLLLATAQRSVTPAHDPAGTNIEAHMTQTTKPDRNKVREYFERRAHDPEPPPSPDEIRRQLGWALVEAEREQAEIDERN
jgi:hypothetical protein